MRKLTMIAVFLLLGLGITMGQSTLNPRIPLIGSAAPSFKAQSTQGEINFPKDYGTHWKVLFSHPRNYTPVCSTELIELAYAQEEFKAMNTEVIVVSTDNIDRHYTWKAALEEVSFKGKAPVAINFPLVDDSRYIISNSYGMLDSSNALGQSIRGVFFIDPENRVRAFYFYPNEVGRNVEEIKRTLVALQANHADNRVLLPVNWQPGDDVMLPYLTDEEQLSVENPDSEFYKESWFMMYKKSK